MRLPNKCIELIGPRAMMFIKAQRANSSCAPRWADADTAMREARS